MAGDAAEDSGKKDEKSGNQEYAIVNNKMKVSLM